jgi:DoxX-like family
LPGRGGQAVQPVQVYELAEAVARLLEQAEPLGAVLEIGGGETLSYREMLGRYRQALALGDALWLPLPLPLMQLAAWLAEALPQQVICRDTLRLLAQGSVPRVNALPQLLGRAATGMQQGLAAAPPLPAIGLQVQLSTPVAWALRAALAFMWLYTAAVSALLPQASGVMALLARCGFEGQAGVLALVACCALNTALGLSLLRPSAVAYAAQCAAVLGYTFTAAWHMPELGIDHCGPLVKNLPVLVAVVVLWLDGQRAVLQSQAARDYKGTSRRPAAAHRGRAHTEMHQPSR